MLIIAIIIIILIMWNNIVEKANQDFEGNKKQYWSFVGRRTKCKNKTISSLISETGFLYPARKVNFKSLSIEESNFRTEIRSIEERDLHGHSLIQEVLNEWEKHVQR